MKQAFLRLIRHDSSLFIEPMKRWFQSFGYRTAIGPTGSESGSRRPTASMSANVAGLSVAGLSNEAGSSGETLKRTSAQTALDVSQLDAELVRDVFTRAQVSGANATAPESEPSFADGSAVPGHDKTAPEEGSYLEAAALFPVGAQEDFPDVETALADATQLPQAGTRPSPGTGASTGRDIVTQATEAPKVTQEAPSTPLVKTMVETIAKRRGAGEPGLGLLPDGLEDLFLRNARVNVGVKTLLLDVEPVDVRMLIEELNDFARTIGAIE